VLPAYARPTHPRKKADPTPTACIVLSGVVEAMKKYTPAATTSVAATKPMITFLVSMTIW
jgi:hypothetical protein